VRSEGVPDGLVDAVLVFRGEAHDRCEVRLGGARALGGYGFVTFGWRRFGGLRGLVAFIGRGAWLRLTLIGAAPEKGDADAEAEGDA